jgi:hypothetical protein
VAASWRGLRSLLHVYTAQGEPVPVAPATSAAIPEHVLVELAQFRSETEQLREQLSLSAQLLAEARSKEIAGPPTAVSLDEWLVAALMPTNGSASDAQARLLFALKKVGPPLPPPSGSHTLAIALPLLIPVLTLLPFSSSSF